VSGFVMRVLHVINDLATGGAETVLFRLTTYPSDVEHEVICLQHRSTFSEKLEDHGIRVHHLDWVSPMASLRPFARLLRLTKASGADIVQAWMYRSNVFAAVAGKLAGIPVVWNIRSSSVAALRPASRMLAYAGGRLAKWLPEAVINCSAVSKQIHGRLGYDSVGGAIIPNGYDAQLFRPDEAVRARIRAELGFEEDCFLVGCIGRWDSHKNYPLLLRTLRLLHDRGIPLRLLLVGRGLHFDNPELAELIKSSGCAAFVQAIGERSDVPDVARALDLHVLASVSEGFPNVVAETMLSATPNAVTDVGDAALIVGDAGWVVPPGDAGLLARAVELARDEWANSPDRWGERRTAARQRIVERFSLGRMVEAYQEVWEQVVSSAA
jgi:glycosyltransferase involved in cell wall biosynthesis